MICLFERDTASPLWRHAEVANGDYQGRPAVELVMRTIPSLGNYDYVIDWVLTEAEKFASTSEPLVSSRQKRCVGHPR